MLDEPRTATTTLRLIAACSLTLARVIFEFPAFNQINLYSTACKHSFLRSFVTCRSLKRLARTLGSRTVFKFQFDQLQLP